MKYLLIGFCFLFSTVSIAQKTSLADMLWKEAGGRIDISADNGGAYEIIDDAKNGYLQVAFTEDGCGCYYETTVAAYKDAKGGYTTLKMEWDACGNRKTFSSNVSLAKVLPKDLGLQSFISNSKEKKETKRHAFLYLQARLPKKGTDTRIDIEFVPFGFKIKGDHSIISFDGYVTVEGNHNYRGDLKQMFQVIKDPKTIEHIAKGEFEKIEENDKKSFDNLFGENRKYKNFKIAQGFITQLSNYYNLSKAIEYKSIILEWNRKEARFFIKEKIKNDTPQQSFLEFLKQLPFLMATC